MPLIYTTSYRLSKPIRNQNFSNLTALLHMEGSDGGTVFTDSSGVGAFTVVGTVTTKTANKKFGNSSAYFNGGGGYLNAFNKSGYSFGTGDFTVEAFVYFDSLAGSGQIPNSCIIAGLAAGNDGNGANMWDLIVTPSGSVVFENAPTQTTAASFGVVTPTGVITTGQWYHIAVTREAGLLRIFVNGVSQTLNRVVGSNTAGAVQSDGPLRIGRLFSSTSWDYRLNGYVDEVRITKGYAHYIADFTAPSEPFADPTPDVHFNKVTFLAHFDDPQNSYSLTDQKGSIITRNGNPFTSTEQIKFGLASVKLNGASDYLSLASAPFFGFGTGDFTIECWFYSTNIMKGVAALLDTRANTTSAQTKVNIEIDSGRLYFMSAGASIASTASVSESVWNHVAMSRTAGVTRCFLNGIQVGSDFADTRNYGSSAELLIGQVGNQRTFNGYFPGYIDDVRVTKGVGRYTTNFSVPTEAFPNV